MSIHCFRICWAAHKQQLQQQAQCNRVSELHKSLPSQDAWLKHSSDQKVALEGAQRKAHIDVCAKTPLLSFLESLFNAVVLLVEFVDTAFGVNNAALPSIKGMGGRRHFNDAKRVLFAIVVGDCLGGLHR